ncbi:uncharacterized protein CLUP02_03379 [Colletotrichum lupini]|uniref:Uncharacterized protein n=1 Tax=Colletotrichum lupini TaxID=145971 RepID=A0A9Q8SJ86_9PEZI|nr:uncharacterized protein CLUP02_03379 [Colletotrichum lupini]UQC77906.1 hypothetical protein CLUP02_03379 [Colletotrichum lupini]
MCLSITQLCHELSSLSHLTGPTGSCSGSYQVALGFQWFKPPKNRRSPFSIRLGLKGQKLNSIHSLAATVATIAATLELTTDLGTRQCPSQRLLTNPQSIKASRGLSCIAAMVTLSRRPLTNTNRKLPNCSSKLLCSIPENDINLALAFADNAGSVLDEVVFDLSCLSFRREAAQHPSNTKKSDVHWQASPLYNSKKRGGTSTSKVIDEERPHDGTRSPAWMGCCAVPPCSGSLASKWCQVVASGKGTSHVETRTPPWPFPSFTPAGRWPSSLDRVRLLGCHAAVTPAAHDWPPLSPVPEPRDFGPTSSHPCLYLFSNLFYAGVFGGAGWENLMALVTPRNAQLICECNVSVAAHATQRDETSQLPGVSSHVSSFAQARFALLAPPDQRLTESFLGGHRRSPAVNRCTVRSYLPVLTWGLYEPFPRAIVLRTAAAAVFSTALPARVVRGRGLFGRRALGTDRIESREKASSD